VISKVLYLRAFVQVDPEHLEGIKRGLLDAGLLSDAVSLCEIAGATKSRTGYVALAMSSELPGTEGKKFLLRTYLSTLMTYGHPAMQWGLCICRWSRGRSRSDVPAGCRCARWWRNGRWWRRSLLQNRNQSWPGVCTPNVGGVALAGC
jgi:hypothetical protein